MQWEVYSAGNVSRSELQHEWIGQLKLGEGWRWRHWWRLTVEREEEDWRRGKWEEKRTDKAPSWQESPGWRGPASRSQKCLWARSENTPCQGWLPSAASVRCLSTERWPGLPCGSAGLRSQCASRPEYHKGYENISKVTNKGPILCKINWTNVFPTMFLRYKKSTSLTSFACTTSGAVC